MFSLVLMDNKYFIIYTYTCMHARQQHDDLDYMQQRFEKWEEELHEEVIPSSY